MGSASGPPMKGSIFSMKTRVWREAITACNELIGGLDRDWKAGIDWQMDIMDETGAVRCRLRFSAETGPT